MAFNKLMRALGFGGEEEYDDTVDYPSALPVQQSVAAHHTVDSEPQEINESGHDDAEVSAGTQEPEQAGEPDFPLTIFDSLLQVFNDAQPDFIRKCLDVDAQRRYLYDSIDSSFKEYIARYQATVREQARSEAESASGRLREELEQLRERCRNVDSLEEDLKHQRISADRQKRTFGERIRDLEGKISTAEAEKEQLQLEIKSLLNKVKVAAVHEKDAKAYKEDLDNLRRQMRDGNQAEISQMRESMENANQRVSAMNAQNMALEAEADKLRREIESLGKVIEGQKLTISESEALVDKLRADADARAAETEALLAETRGRLAEAEARLAGMASAPVVAGPDVQPQEPVAEQPAVSEEQKPKRKKRKPRLSKTKISAIDESLDETEWLVATPPEGVVSKAVSVASDSDFGYQEPPRKQPPVNDAQMSLF